MVQVNAAAGKCWLRRQLRVRLGGSDSSAIDGGSPADAAADVSAGAAPLLSVPAADVCNLLHPYSQCSRYTLVSDSGVEQEIAFGSGGSNGGGDMCSSNDGELASFLQAAGISPGSNVAIAVCNDMQHLHISQLHQSTHHPPASTTAAAPRSAAAHAGDMEATCVPAFSLAGRAGSCLPDSACCLCQTRCIACQHPLCHAGLA